MPAEALSGWLSTVGNIGTSLEPVCGWLVFSVDAIIGVRSIPLIAGKYPG